MYVDILLHRGCGTLIIWAVGYSNQREKNTHELRDSGVALPFSGIK